MLSASFWTACAAVGLGIVLVLAHGMKRLALARWLGPLHGATGAAALALLVLAVRGGAVRGSASGVAAFGTISAAMLGAAMLAGLLVWRLRARRSDPLVAIGIHASLAIFGFALLAAYVAAPA